MSKTSKTVTITLPEGIFEGNCADCLYANFYDRDSYGRVKCEGHYGGYNRPEDRNGCFYHSDYDRRRR